MGFDFNEIKYHYGGNNKIIISTDPFKLNQVVYNLLINSIKYSENEPNKFRILIELDETKDFITIKFKDWGIGISDQYITDIFTEGFRCPEAYSMDVAGAGLGLSISKTIMQKLGGSLLLVRRAKPTEFHIKLPK